MSSLRTDIERHILQNSTRLRVKPMVRLKFNLMCSEVNLNVNVGLVIVLVRVNEVYP